MIKIKSEEKRRSPHCLCAAWLLVLLATGLSVPALDITGVQIAAMDQPRVTVMFRRTANGTPLAAKGNAVLADLLGDGSGTGDTVNRFAAYLDTGASGIVISRTTADSLGIRYKEGTRNTESPLLEGVAVDKQFTLSLGGIGGTKKAAGFYVAELRVPTTEGDPLVYRAAPVLVNDITVEHPVTKQKVTLDGVFGMNLLVASAQITEGLVPDLGNMSEGPYDLIVIDHLKSVLGLQLRLELHR